MQSRPRPATPSQTIGPYFGFALPWAEGPLVAPAGDADAFWIRGTVTDGEGAAVADALIETWQAWPDGSFPEPGSVGRAGRRGFGRCPTDARGEFALHTLRPGAVAGPDGAQQAPHVDVAVFARGLLRPLITRIYFPESPENQSDPVLSSLPPERRSSLIAEAASDGYRFDIRLQGDGETAFFDL